MPHVPMLTWLLYGFIYFTSYIYAHMLTHVCLLMQYYWTRMMAHQIKAPAIQAFDLSLILGTYV